MTHYKFNECMSMSPIIWNWKMSKQTLPVLSLSYSGLLRGYECICTIYVVLPSPPGNCSRNDGYHNYHPEPVITMQLTIKCYLLIFSAYSSDNIARCICIFSLYADFSHSSSMITNSLPDGIFRNVVRIIDVR